MTELIACVAAIAVSAGLTALLIRLAPRLGLVDRPDPRKVHSTPIPRGGGLAIFAAVALGLLAPHDGGPAASFWIACAGIVLLGLLDDLFTLPWWSRLPVQAGLALWLIGWPGEVDLVVAFVGLFWIVGLVNAFNMIDNMDAQSAGVAWIAAAAFAVLLLLQPGRPAAWPYLLLVGALTGFLFFNWPPARIFMGDAGSTFLGFFLAVRTWQDGFLQPGTMVAGTLGILVFPWYDLFVVVGIRLGQGRSPFLPDKQHFAHRRVDAGLSQAAAVRVIHLLTLTSAAAGVVFVAMGFGVWIAAATLAAGWLLIAAYDYNQRARAGTSLEQTPADR